MKYRLFSTLLLWTVVGASLYFFGPTAGILLIALVAALTQYELYGMLEKMGLRPFRNFGTFLGVFLILGSYFIRLRSGPGESGLETSILAITIIVCCLRVLRERDASNRVETLAATIFGLVYVPFLFHFLVRVYFLGDSENAGLLLVLWLVVAAKFCDVGGLLAGSVLGRHKMSPEVSPKKTWEGAIGGITLSMVASFLLVLYFREQAPEGFHPWLAALLAFPVACAAILSDLVESILKRRADVKDSGRLIPGIGGAFDLSDSLLLAAPVGYLLLRLFLFFP